VASLVDTNILVYRCDHRFPAKRQVAMQLLRDGVGSGQLVLAHQAVIEFVAATTRPRADLGGDSLLERHDAALLADELLREFVVLYPDRSVVRTALDGAARHQLSWYDAHMWAYAEVNGLDEILTEDFAHGHHYGSVRAHDPFLVAADEVHELPPLYEEDRGRTLGDRIRGLTSKSEIGFT
jgi:predicted nucleic acid-binding protein